MDPIVGALHSALLLPRQMWEVIKQFAADQYLRIYIAGVVLATVVGVRRVEHRYRKDCVYS